MFYDKSNEACKVCFSSFWRKYRSCSWRKDVNFMLLKFKQIKNKHTQDNGSLNLDAAKTEDVKAHLLASGCWPFVKQRPYDVIANPNNAPKAIFVSAYASAPLAADLDFTLQGKEAELQAAVSALTKLN